MGGAGAQKEIGIKIIKSLRFNFTKREVKVILSAGIREKVRDYFEAHIKRLFGGRVSVSSGIEIICEKDSESYFQKFNQALRKWKPLIYRE